TVRPITLSHRSQEVLSLMISRGCHSALYGCLMHNFLPEVSHGALARVHVLCWHSGCRALGVLRARGSPRSNSIVFYLDSSLMVQGLWAPGASVGQQLWLEEPPFLDSLEVNEIGGGVCESALKLLHKSEGLQVYARVRTLLGKSDRSGSQGGLRKRGCCARRSSIPTHQQYPTRYGSKVTHCLMPSDKTPTVTRLASAPRGHEVSASTRRRWGRMHGMVNTCERLEAS